MLEFASDFERGLLLFALSAVCLVAGHACRKWPEKVQEFSATLDGSVFFLGLESHLRIVRRSGLVLTIVSYATLVPAALMF